MYDKTGLINILVYKWVIKAVKHPKYTPKASEFIKQLKTISGPSVFNSTLGDNVLAVFCKTDPSPCQFPFIWEGKEYR
jgi:hypothetical protein